MDLAMGTLDQNFNGAVEGRFKGEWRNQRINRPFEEFHSSNKGEQRNGVVT